MCACGEKLTKHWTMRGACVLVLVVAVALAVAVTAEEKVDQLHIGVLKKPSSCNVRAKNGDTISVHYTGTLLDGGDKFDSSVDRGEPIEFELGAGRVIKGWEKGLVGMCKGEKRKLIIPAHLAYGERGSGSGSIGPGASIVFETEMMDIKPKRR